MFQCQIFRTKTQPNPKVSILYSYKQTFPHIYIYNNIMENEADYEEWVAEIEAQNTFVAEFEEEENTKRDLYIS